MISRKFVISEQAGVPAAAPVVAFTSTTHIGTNTESLDALVAADVKWSSPTDEKSDNSAVDVYLVISGTAAGGVDYSVNASPDGAVFIAASSGTIATNGLTIIPNIRAPYIVVGVNPNAAGGSAGSVVCTVTGTRQMYRSQTMVDVNLSGAQLQDQTGSDYDSD